MEAVNCILVVCIGNICRSPAAQGFFRDTFQRKNIACRVDSAGLSAMVDDEADLSVREITLENYRINLSDHRAKQLTQDMVLQHDLILTMDLEQAQSIQLKYPFSCGKVHQLGKWQKKSIVDPYRQSRVFDEHDDCIWPWIL